MRDNITRLIAKKELDENRRITTEEILRQTGISRSTLWRLQKRNITGTRLDVIERLCKYFDCQPGDLLYMEESHVDQ